jgi:hypothetical protein
MSRFLAFAAIASFAAAMLAMAACSSSTANDTESSDGGVAFRRDGAPVDLPDGGATKTDGGAGPSPPSCAKYCELVTKNCVGDQAQYASRADCEAFCKHLPKGISGDQDSTVGCRQYYAGNPARANPGASCTAAGPFGGGVCGDRCAAFCDVALSACKGGEIAYESLGTCATACANFVFRDAQSDGGGETPYGPDHGDSLNCRLYHLRMAVKESKYCSALKPQSDACQ